MKIVHICLSGAVTDGFSYQDNLLSKYHKKMGYDVSFITSKWVYNNDGVIVRTDKNTYFNKDGVKMIRLQNKKGESYNQKFKHFIGLEKALILEKPDILFIHGPQFLEMPEVVRYVKNNNIDVFVDNHADFSNSGRTFLSKYILQGIVWKHMAQIINPYTKKFYGVLPARVEWLKKVYGLPEEKCKLLVMGADDEEVSRAGNKENIFKVRERLNIRLGDFLIVTGGKIDVWKKQTLLLMKAVSRIERTDVKLLVFGPISNEIKGEFDQCFEPDKMRYISWADSSQSYDYFASADLVVFPGRHSVYWEQVAGQGKPMLCKYWEGTTHVNCGGNVIFLTKDTVAEIQSTIQRLLDDPEEYKNMYNIAQGEPKEKFSYKNIARESIEI